jgi:hypothetical protein
VVLLHLLAPNRLAVMLVEKSRTALLELVVASVGPLNQLVKQA